MRDVLYEIMKQVNDPTAFTEMINDVQSQIDKENAAAEQKNVHRDNLRYTLAVAAVDYIEEVFGIEETHSGEKGEIVDKICEALEDAEAEMVKTKMFFDMMRHAMPSKAPAQLKHDGCTCGGNCDCKKPVPEKVIETPEARVEVHKIPVRKDIDVDTVINEFLKSLQ